MDKKSLIGVKGKNFFFFMCEGKFEGREKYMKLTRGKFVKKMETQYG